MRTFLLFVLPVLVVAAIAYHYRTSWLPSLTGVDKSAQPVAVLSPLPVPTPTPTAIPQASLPAEPVIPETPIVQPAPPASDSLPSSGPSLAFLAFLIPVAAVGGGIGYVCRQRAQLRRSLRSIDIA